MPHCRFEFNNRRVPRWMRFDTIPDALAFAQQRLGRKVGNTVTIYERDERDGGEYPVHRLVRIVEVAATVIPEDGEEYPVEVPSATIESAYKLALPGEGLAVGYFETDAAAYEWADQIAQTYPGERLLLYRQHGDRDKFVGPVLARQPEFTVPEEEEV